MQIDLVNAVVSWLVASAGDAGVRLLRGSPRVRELRKATGPAIKSVVEQVDPSSREALSAGLVYCFSSPLRLRPDPSMSIGPWLRSAIMEQVAQLDDWVSQDTGYTFYEDVQVEPEWLKREITNQILAALRQVVAGDDLAELIHGLDTSDIFEKLDFLGQQIGRANMTPSALATRTLPRDIASFTGRSSELNFLAQLVKHADVTGSFVGVHIIDGMPGIGKTAFAVRAAHELSRYFPDGQIFLPLHAHTPGQHPVDPADALASLLLTMGLMPQQIPSDVESRAQLWRHHISDKKIIIVLDDAAGHEQVRPLLPSARRCLVLITSRRRLSAIEDTMPITLDPLPLEEATALLIRLASRRDLDASAASSREIVRRCGHLPLAIGMMARHLGNHHAWTAADLAAELATTQDRLALLHVENLSVTTAFDLSYQELTLDEQHLFRRLGLLPGVDIDAYATAAVAEISLPSAQHLLDQLYDRHIITEPSRGRYRFHDLIREYARALAAGEDAALRERATDGLLDYYLHTATIANHHLTRRSPFLFPPVNTIPAWVPDLSTPAKASTWMEAERGNLNAAAEYAAYESQPRHAIEIPAAMNGFLCTQGYWGQAIELHHTALTTARQAADDYGQAVALNQLGHVHRLTSSYGHATASQEQALALFRTIADRHGQANALDSLGVVQYLQGDYSSANSNLVQALALYRELDDRLGQAEALLHLGAGQQATGSYPAAIHTLSEALELQRGLSHVLGEAETLNYLGVVHYLTGNYQDSVRTLTKAIEFQRTLNDHLGQAEALNNRGAVLCEIGNHAGAVDNLRDALLLYEDLGNRRGQASVLNNLGALLVRIGDLTGAQATLTNALALHQELGNRRGEANALRYIGLVQRLAGDYDASIDNAKSALRIFQDIGDRCGEAEALNDLGGALTRSSNPETGSVMHDQALAIAKEIGVPLEEARALESLAHICFSLGDFREGAARLSGALAIFQRIGSSRAQHIQERRDIKS